jgi:hypothetical protein
LHSCGYFLATSSSRDKATLPSLALVAACSPQALAFSAGGGDGGSGLEPAKLSLGIPSGPFFGTTVCLKIKIEVVDIR